MTISASTLRNIIAILRNIDRDQIEIEYGRDLSSSDWTKFRDDPYTSFLRMNDDQQDAIARIVSERMEPCAGADDPEERCPRHPRDCTCWQIDVDAFNKIRSDFHGEPPALQSALQVKGAVI